MPHFLISGISELIDEIGAVLAEHGATYVGVPDNTDVPKAVAEAEAPFDGYIQLSVPFVVQGDTAITRLHHFFAEGVLARFPAMAAAAPALAPGSRVTFVMAANLPPAVSTEDDLAARHALTKVLERCAKADGPAGLRTTILESGTSAREIALTALGNGSQEDSPQAAGDDYGDWRTELLGMMWARV